MDKIKISHEIPPIYERLVERFGIDWNDGVVITYGDTMYVKEGMNITRDLIVHESVHMMRQNTLVGAVAWWDRYIDDDLFRQVEEAAAYRAQWQFLKRTMDREKAFKRKLKLIKDFSSSMYGNIVTAKGAEILIGK